METPASVHEQSKRPFPDKIREWEYPVDMKVMQVTQNGSIRWKSYWKVFMTQGLIGKSVGAEEQGNGMWKVYYRDVFIGYFNEKDIRDK